MGGSVSSGRNNDELIDNLIEVDLIKTQMVERAFRAVDRGTFYLNNHKDNAYRDLAWREGNIHISAPCIYARVMESLMLKPGQSFLNIGSGTGYLSSMVGLILGSNGINHNIELHGELIEYSKIRVSEFIRTSDYFDDFDFCAPIFVHGNVFNLIVNEDSLSYDRIYVGAAINEQQESFVKNLLKRDGILVMPLNEHLVKVTRVDENTWETSAIMNVSFASIVNNDSIDESALDGSESSDGNSRLNDLDVNKKKFKIPKLKPYTLQELCRFRIRQLIRVSIESEIPDYYKIERVVSTFNKDRKLKMTSPSSLAESRGNSSDENSDLDEEDMQLSLPSPLNRLEQIMQFNTSNQLRLVVYGHLIENRANRLRAAINSTPRSADRDSSLSSVPQNLTDMTEPSSDLNRDAANSASSSYKVASKEIDIPKGEALTSIQAAASCSANDNNMSLGESGFDDEFHSMPSSVDSTLMTKSPVLERSNLNTTNEDENSAKSSKKTDTNCECEKHGIEELILSDKKTKLTANAGVVFRGENLMIKKIQQLPLSSQVKAFILYNRKM